MWAGRHTWGEGILGAPMKGSKVDAIDLRGWGYLMERGVAGRHSGDKTGVRTDRCHTAQLQGQHPRGSP